MVGTRGPHVRGRLGEASLPDLFFQVMRKIIPAFRRGLTGAGGRGGVQQLQRALPQGGLGHQLQPFQRLRRGQLAVYLAGGGADPGDNVGERCCVARPFSITSLSVSGGRDAIMPIIAACALASCSVRRWQAEKKPFAFTSLPVLRTSSNDSGVRVKAQDLLRVEGWGLSRWHRNPARAGSSFTRPTPASYSRTGIWRTLISSAGGTRKPPSAAASATGSKLMVMVLPPKSVMFSFMGLVVCGVQ